MNPVNTRPKIIVITGIDGSGKTTLTDWLSDELVKRGHKPRFIWSRFNNYLSIPFLAITKLTGHNYYENNDNVRMGYHDFEKFPLLIKYLFIWLQIIDVNIATFFKINRPSKKHDLTICERGPWDTLVDVRADTEIIKLNNALYRKFFFGQLNKLIDVVLIDREIDNIESVREELKYDTKLRDRQQYFRELAKAGDWTILNNNRTISDAKNELSNWLDKKGF